MTPKSAKPTSSTTVLEAAKARRRKKRSGSIGSAPPDSPTTKRAPRTRAAARKPAISGEPQEWLEVRMKPQVSAKSPAVTSTVPTTSRLLAVESRDSRTAHAATAAPIRPTGTLTQKTADHEK